MINAEELVIGGCLLNEDAVPFAANHLVPEDFHSVKLAEVFRAIVQTKKSGDPVEVFSIWSRCQANGVKGLAITELHEWVGNVGASVSVDYYAREVKEQSTRRKLNLAGMRYQQSVTDPSIPPAKAVSDMVEELQAIRDQSTNETVRAKSLGEILDMPEVEADWVIPNLFEKGDRMIITGYEGLGKTTWIRQMGICMAAGINPVTLDHIDPVRVLVVDAENSETQWRRETHAMAAVAAKHGTVSPRDNLFLHCSKRMDIRRDKDLGLVHRLVDENKPEVLFIGPIYRLSPNGIKNDEEAAPIIAALDTLRDRGLVLVMEAHAPKGGPDGRNLAPRGSAALMGWPEFGFGLAPTETGADVTRWRGDRDRNRDWPETLHRGGPLPWTADTVSNYTRQKFYGWDKTA
jgi:AAA domain/DnaB-like helicase N terminal domain